MCYFILLENKMEFKPVNVAFWYNFLNKWFNAYKDVRVDDFQLENVILKAKFMVFKLFCFKCQGCSLVSSAGLIKVVRDIENRNEIKYDIWKNKAENCENSHPSLGKNSIWIKLLQMGSIVFKFYSHQVMKF